MAISGTNESDFLAGTIGSDRIFGLAGDDTIIALAGDDQIFGGDGDDLIIAGDGIDFIEGGIGNDDISGDAGNDTINGGDGVDVINGGDGNDFINGGNGGDRINGDAGDDLINGNAGNDIINGGDGADLISGDAGNDRIFGGAGNDDISGGIGDDQLNGDAGDDIVQGGAGNDIVFGGTGFGNDTLTGGDGADTLIGGAGNDNLSGGNGTDRLIGVEPFAPGFGFIFDEIDTLTGGANRDTFVLGSASDLYYDNGGNFDYALITDFNINEDVIELPSFTQTASVSVAEIGDAGQFLFDSQFIPGGSGTLNSISGTLSSGSDVDIFQITLTGGGTFSASTVGTTFFDTQLFLFDQNGFGVLANDQASFSNQSTLFETTILAPGTYFLAITDYDNDPFSEGGLIFPTGFGPDETVVGPTEVGGGSPLSGFTGNGFSGGGAYTISLTGVQAAPPISLGTISINNVVGTGISFNNDLIAVVQGVSISDFSSGFVFV
ncbi:MAG: DVUA0089 family protein [Nostoc sp. TH1S01]|nr:DVUA0089 family protein [Nostoc sp. TH1S01]